MVKAGYSIRDKAWYNNKVYYQVAVFTMHKDYVQMREWLTNQYLLDPTNINCRTPTTWWIHEHVLDLFILTFGEGYIDD